MAGGDLSLPNLKLAGLAFLRGDSNSKVFCSLASLRFSSNYLGAYLLLSYYITCCFDSDICETTVSGVFLLYLLFCAPVPLTDF